jgi:hypothetical protein
VFNALLYLGLCATAFAFFPSVDLREIKMTAAVVFALALSMAEIYKSGIKPCKNLWVLLLLAYIPISIIFSPSPQIDLDGMQVKNFWSWLPFVKILVFGLLFITISGHEFKMDEIKTVLKVMVWCGFLTALYEISQFFFADQFFIRVADGDWGRIAGFIGNPTLTAPFCAMLVPLALYFEDLPKAFILSVGAIIPDSQMAWVALTAGLICYVSFKGKWWMSVMVITGLCMSLLFIDFYQNNQHIRNVFNDHERFKQWHQILKDWVGPLDKEKGFINNYALTGRGIGSFRFVYHIQHINIGSPNRFHQAHNDFLEFGYCTGFIGFGLLIASIFHMLKRSFIGIFENRLNRALVASFIIACVAGTGVFAFQVGTFSFFVTVICGLLHNKRTLQCQLLPQSSQ